MLSNRVATCLNVPVTVQVPVSDCESSRKAPRWSVLWLSWYTGLARHSQESILSGRGWWLLLLGRRTSLAFHQTLGSRGLRTLVSPSLSRGVPGLKAAAGGTAGSLK